MDGEAYNDKQCKPWPDTERSIGALDSGAHGIVVPLLYTADDAKKLVQTAKFPPVGQRGYGSPFTMHCFGDITGAEYLQQANEGLVTIVQIETKEALENVEEIAKVPGIDVLLIGPYDLGNNIGHPILGEVPQPLRDAIAKIRTAAKAAGKKAGIYSISGEQAKMYADEGFQMVSVVADVVAVPTFFSRALTAAKGPEGSKVVENLKGLPYGTGSSGPK
ncbi:MAG: hypothetical protein Q9227_009530 [Pyrenula ochraceoflavens]